MGACPRRHRGAAPLGDLRSPNPFPSHYTPLSLYSGMDRSLAMVGRALFLVDDFPFSLCLKYFYHYTGQAARRWCSERPSVTEAQLSPPPEGSGSMSKIISFNARKPKPRLERSVFISNALSHRKNTQPRSGYMRPDASTTESKRKEAWKRGQRETAERVG